MDTLKGKQIMVWTFMGNARMYEALRDYGDRISQIDREIIEASSAVQLRSDKYGRFVAHLAAAGLPGVKTEEEFRDRVGGSVLCQGR